MFLNCLLKRVGLGLLATLMAALSTVAIAADNTGVDESADKLAQATQCTQMHERLKRLRCFDETFATPLKQVHPVTASEVPLAWQRAVASEQQHGADQPGFHLSMLDSSMPKEGIWLTQTANGENTGSDSLPPAPILMLSCIDNISRVELILPKSVEPGRVEISMIGGEKSRRRWLNDDSGTVLQAGRGIPAIQLMKKLLGSSTIILRSSLPEADGLTFNSQHLEDSIQSLRRTCNW